VIQGDDRILIERLKQGDKNAFEEVMQTYQLPLIRLAYRVVGDMEMSADIVQDTFYTLYNSINRFNGKSDLFTYLYRIVTNKSITVVRKQKRRTKIHQRIKQDIRDGTKIEKADMEIKLLLNQALQSIPAKLKVPLLLAEIDQLSYKEIANILTIPLNTVRTRIFRAREKLKTILEQMGVSL
jgi:RNA polymerase sigma-70 factor (ECF subfamily)